MSLSNDVQMPTISGSTPSFLSHLSSPALQNVRPEGPVQRLMLAFASCRLGEESITKPSSVMILSCGERDYLPTVYKVRGPKFDIVKV